MKTRSLLVALVPLALVSVLVAQTAHALPPITSPLGQHGQLVIDQVSGLRLGTDGALNYYGPIGFSVRSYTERQFTQPPIVDNTIHQTTFWLAPSADIFVIDHLSVGGLLEVSITSSNFDSNSGGVSQSNPATTTTNFKLLPRVGWMFALSDRFGIWPRLALGYASLQSLQANVDTFSGFVMDVDVGFVLRVTNGWFFRAAPELSILPGASHSQTQAGPNGLTTTAGASAFQFAVTSGVGVLFDL